MVPGNAKQQQKQRRTVYGQSFFNSPPYQQQPIFVEREVPVRENRLDSSLNRKRQLPVPKQSTASQIS